ncbi:hypothetical protein PDR5_29260 [Pseudomonas sp. DR 5-09]|nr:hypothetical protein PDR5_29260 [Pseudomonas sp. DR 5-09]
MPGLFWTITVAAHECRLFHCRQRSRCLCENRPSGKYMNTCGSWLASSHR